MDEADYFPGVDFSEYDVQGLAAYMKRATNLPGHREAQESKIKCSFKEYNKAVKPRGSVFTDTEVMGILHDLAREETKTFTGDVFYMLLFPGDKFYTDEQLEHVMRTKVATRIRKTFKIERLREKQEKKRAREALANTAGGVQTSVGIPENLDVLKITGDIKIREERWDGITEMDGNGGLFFIHKDNYVPIPEDFLISGGDVWTYECQRILKRKNYYINKCFFYSQWGVTTNCKKVDTSYGDFTKENRENYLQHIEQFKSKIR